jgi:hypothetical protein
MLINTNLNFKIHTDSMGLVAILFEDGVFTYFNGEEMIELGGEKELYKFLFSNNASYVDDGQNLRALVLSYQVAKIALNDGCKLHDRNGNTYQLDPQSDCVLVNDGDVRYRQLPYGRYILDIQRNIELEEERQREETRQLEEERQAALAAANAPKKKGTPWWKIAAAVFGGAVLLGGGLYCVTKK